MFTNNIVLEGRKNTAAYIFGLQAHNVLIDRKICQASEFMGDCSVRGDCLLLLFGSVIARIDDIGSKGQLVRLSMVDIINGHALTLWCDYDSDIVNELRMRLGIA